MQAEFKERANDPKVGQARIVTLACRRCRKPLAELVLRGRDDPERKPTPVKASCPCGGNSAREEVRSSMRYMAVAPLLLHSVAFEDDLAIIKVVNP